MHALSTMLKMLTYLQTVNENMTEFINMMTEFDTLKVFRLHGKSTIIRVGQNSEMKEIELTEFYLECEFIEFQL